MGTILSKRHFLANFDKQAIAVTEFTDFLSIYAMPRLGELLVATSLLLTASQEVNGTEDGGQNGKGTWSLLSIMLLTGVWKGVIASLQLYIPGLMMEREGEPAWRFWQWRSLGQSWTYIIYIYIYYKTSYFQDPKGPQRCCIFKASIHTTMLNGWNTTWLQQYELQHISVCKVWGWWIFWWPVTLGWIIKSCVDCVDYKI